MLGCQKDIEDIELSGAILENWKVPKVTQCYPYCVLGVVPVVDLLYRITQVTLERISRDDLKKKKIKLLVMALVVKFFP